MKILFLVFHGFDAFNGISKKILYQVDALRTLGHTVALGSLITDEQGHWKQLCDDRVVSDLGRGAIGKLKKRVSYTALTQEILREKFDLVYIRSNHNANPFTIRMVRRIRRAGIQIVMEIPTYPYDQEYATLGLKEHMELLIDQLFRRRFARYLNAVVTFSESPVVFGQRTICISNGISYDAIPMRHPHTPVAGELHLVAVADISFWHGFDRAVQGLAAYYAAGKQETAVFLRIVGRGRTEVLDELRRLVGEHHLEHYVTFTGPLFGEMLDREFDRADMAIGSLGRHRSGITHIKTLKNREYAVRGIPFVYSEYDSDFEQMPYILKAPADESPLDMNRLATFCREGTYTAEEIRRSVRSLSWENQMQHVLNAVNQQDQA